MAAQADTKHQSMLSLSAKIFCSRLPQSEIGYSTKILYRLFGLLPYWAAIPLHVKKLAVMVNGTTYTEKLRLNTRNGNRVIDTIIS